MLYIDLLKSSTGTAVGQDTNIRSAQRKMQIDTSYAREPVGVMGGPGKADDPDKGPQAKHGKPLDEELEEERQAYAARAAREGSIQRKEVSKAIAAINSLSDIVSEQLSQYHVTPEEYEFLTKHLGYSETDIYKGKAVIAGRDREKFSGWLLDRFISAAQELNNV